MSELWLDITDIPATGRDFSFSDQGLWAEGIAEFSLPHRLDAPGSGLSAEFSVTPEGRGVFIRGRVTGQLVTPCDRCAEDTVVVIDNAFELFEELPLEDEESLEPGLIRRRGKLVELDAAGILWEQFLLGMPVKPLCDDACPGLCPRCGKPLRDGPCGCGPEEGDPRLAVLKNVKVKRQTN